MESMVKKISSSVDKSIKSLSSDGVLDISEAFQLFQNVPVEIAIYDVDRKYRYVNNLYAVDEKLRAKIIGKDDAFYFRKIGINSDCVEKRQVNFSKALEQKRTIRFTEKLEFTHKKKVLYYKRSFQPIFSDTDNKITGVCLYGSDLTAVIHGQQELKYLAFHDKLTGLKNRDGFYEQLDQIIIDLPRDTEKRFSAILFCDLDNFKLVNDSLGHDIGDMVLVEASKRIKNSLRKTDFVFRLGGDEFTVIIRHLHNHFEAGMVASKIIHNLSQPYRIRGHNITYLSTSVGIVLITEQAGDRETIVKKADTAMYESKRKGKNQFQFYTESMSEDSLNRLQIENNLQNMVRNNEFSKQLKMLYQPIIEQKDDGKFKIIGSEALLRWNSPELGRVLPGAFIGIAEETNLISSMGDWILQKVCKDIYPVTGENEDFYVSINLSAKQLKSEHIVEKIKRIIKLVKIRPENIQLELTETSYMEDEKEVSQRIAELRELGVRLAIDDFGIGFASLVYLQNIPASTIKIDRSFVRHVCSSKKDQQLVKSIIDMGINLEKDVVAEGVEKPEHLQFLGSQRCHKYQGYLFSRPLTLNDLKKILRKENPFSF
jgi:diguanylate cyclase (GGDEF)-like protein